MLVDDDEADRRLVKLVLSKASPLVQFDIETAQNAAEAACRLTDASYDVVLLDLGLPDSSGVDTVRKAHYVNPDVPIVVLTGLDDEETGLEAIRNGAEDYIVKGKSLEYLLVRTIRYTIERKRAIRQARQLASEKELLSVTLSSMGDGVIAVDATRTVVLFNRMAEKLTGWKFEQASAKNINELFRLVDQKSRKPLLSPVEKAFESGRVESQTNCDLIVDQNNARHPVSLTAAPICKNSGTIMGVVMVLHDISREREIDKMKTDFVSSVSHELRTPLTSIKAYTTTLLRDKTMPDHVRNEFLDIINDESDRLAKLIDNLLEVSKIEAGAVKINRRDVDVAVVIERVFSCLRPLADKKNIRLEKDMPAETVKMQADEEKLESVLTNLTNNAIKFTGDGGEVRVSAQFDNEYLVLQVRDNGPGIPAENLPKIFDRFYRVQDHNNRTVKGTGLGLTIVKDIVMMHGGRVDVQSEVGKGTTFTVFLPVTARPELEISADKQK